MATLTVPDSFTSIGAAVTAAKPGDTIIVNDKGSSYNESVDIATDNIRIKANENIVLDGIATVFGYAFWVNSNNVIIEGFTIKNHDNGIILHGSNNTVTKCILQSISFGIGISGIGRHNITKNTIETTYISITLDSNKNRILNNIITSTCSKAFHLSYSHCNTISTNTITADNHGFTLNNSNSNIINSNIIDVGDKGFLLENSNNNTIRKNTIRGSNEGIYIDCSNCNTINSNVITAPDGKSIVQLGLTTGNTLSQNTIVY